MAAAVIFFGKVVPKSIIISGITFLLCYISILVVIGVVVTAVIMRKKGKFGKNKSEKKGTE